MDGGRRWRVRSVCAMRPERDVLCLSLASSHLIEKRMVVDPRNYTLRRTPCLAGPGRARPGLGDAQHVVRGVLFEEERPLSSVEILFSIWQEDPDNVRPLLDLPRRLPLSSRVGRCR